MSFSESTHYELMVKAAYYYYKKELTQTRIAELLGISRLTLSRVLKEAKAEGIVKIDIVDTRNLNSLLECEDALCRTFGLQQAMVVSCAEDTTEEANQRIAYAGAQYLARTVRSGMKLSITWGSTIKLLVDRLPADRSIQDLEVMTLIGGAGTTVTAVQPEMLAGRILSKYKGRGRTIDAPFFCQSEEVCRFFKDEPAIREVLQGSLASDLTLVGIGEPPSMDAGYWARSCYSDEMLREIIRSGAVGDICGHYIDAAGRPCCDSVNRRLVAADIEDLKRHKCVVAAAGGPLKHTSVRAALRGGYVDVLITDRATAEAILEKP